MTTKPEDALVEKVARAIALELSGGKSDNPNGAEINVAQVALEASGITTLLERERRATVLLRGIVGNANEAMPFGPFDCVDNTGEPYQSEAFAQALRAGRDHLARAALTGEGE